MMGKRDLLQSRTSTIQLYSMLFPAVALYLLFFVYPVFGGIYYSFTDWNGVNPTYNIIGLNNYKTLFQDYYVLEPLKNTFIYAFLFTIFENIVALALAVALESKLRLKNFLRTAYFIPVVVSSLVVGYIWSYICTVPLADLGKLLNIKAMKYNLLGNPNTALYTAVFVATWKQAGYTMIIYIAALQGISNDIYEAADIDGAHGWKKFWNITFPLIAPGFTINMVMTLEKGFKEYDLMVGLTGGGPGHSSELLSLTIYRESFQYYRAGYGATMGVILFVIIIILSLIQLKFFRRREQDIV